MVTPRSLQNYFFIAPIGIQDRRYPGLLHAPMIKEWIPCALSTALAIASSPRGLYDPNRHTNYSEALRFSEHDSSFFCNTLLNMSNLNGEVFCLAS